MIQSFYDLEIFQEGLSCSKIVCDNIKFIPREERDLISQARRCCRSIPCQIAEGYGRKYSEKEFKKYLRNAAAECNEMITHLMMIKYAGYWKPALCDNLLERYKVLGRRTAKAAEVWKNFEQESNV